MHKIEVFHCDYCKKYGKSKSNIGQHEKICLHNPINKACATCDNFMQKKFNTTIDTEQGTLDCVDYLPTCFKGESIASLQEKKKILNLKSKCDKWEERNYDNEDYEE